MYAKFFKRFLDLLVSLVALILLSPLLLILTIIGTIAMRGDPFFRQPRPGKIEPKTGKEHIFCLIKFRTMSDRRGENGELLPDELRLNKYGSFLRSTSLDELPELFNILIGDMSIVGPRPLVVQYLPWYTDEERIRHTVRPGLTGLAQVNGRNNLSWEQRFSFDREYVEHVTFITDVRILFKTVAITLKGSDITVRSSDGSMDFDVYRRAQLKEREQYEYSGTENLFARDRNV